METDEFLDDSGELIDVPNATDKVGLLVYTAWVENVSAISVMGLES